MIKRVLLLNDCSGVHRDLCEGLCNIGVDAVDASGGNAWRKLGSSIDFSAKIWGLPDKISQNVSPFINLPKLMNYDVVQFIRYKSNFNPRFGIEKLLSNIILRTNSKAFLVSTACDPHIWNYYNSGEYDFPQLCKECLRLDLKLPTCVFDGKNEENELNDTLGSFKGVIPLIFEYAEAYRRAGVSNLMATIPIPVNTDKVTYADNKIRSKIVVFHGINRVGFKGTELITTALENVQKKYPNDIEVVIEGKMSLDEYLKLLTKINIVVDQPYSLTYGMNALYSMALGKVVVGGGHAAGLAEYGVSRSPIIPIFPNLKSIEESIEKLIETRNDIPGMGYESRKYVEEVHHYELIARKFLDAWESR